MTKDYDVIILGGGPAGLIAAGSAAQQGASVVILEKNDRPGKKLLITGKERCNITSNNHDLLSFVEAYGKQGKFLLSALSHFGVADIIQFFNSHDVPTKIEQGSKIFPASDKALDVLLALQGYLQELNVPILTNAAAQSINQIDDGFQVVTEKQTITSKSVIISTGGLSYPSLGSSGDGYKFAAKLGHAIIPTEPALISLVLNEPWLESVQALELKNISVTLFQNNKKQSRRQGDALFTQDGITGPMILDMSKSVGRYLKQGPVNLVIDFCPDVEHQILDNQLLEDLDGFRGKSFINVLNEILPKRLALVFSELAGVLPTKQCNSITKTERKRLLNLLKAFPLKVKRLSGFEKAIITVGGVSLKEVDPKTMQSKLVPGLFFAGEVLDLDGPSGGYNLQVCWSTGYMAGQNAAY